MKKMLINISVLLTLLLLVSANAWGQNVFALDVAGNKMFNVSDHADLDVTGDFTIEAWIQFNDFNGRICDRTGVLKLYATTNSIRFDLDAGGSISTGDISSDTGDNSWHHIAVSREDAASATRIFYDGVEKASYDLPLSAGTTAFSVGGQDGWVGAWDARIDEFRFSNSTRYTQDFSVSVTDAPFDNDDANTVLLFHFDDNSQIPPESDGNTYTDFLYDNGKASSDGYEIDATDYVAPAGLPLSLPDIVINEVGEPYTMTGTYNNSYVELYNNSGAAVDVGGWVVWSVDASARGTSSFELPTGTSIADGGYLIATRSRTDFLTNYGTYVDEAIVPTAANTSGTGVYIANSYYFELLTDAGAQVDVTTSTVGWNSSVFEKTAPGDDGTVDDNWHITSQTSPVEGTPGQENSAAPVPTAYTISQIQDTTGTGSEASPFDGEYVETYGVITATASSTYWLQDGTGAWSGIYVYAGYGHTNAMGDSVTIVGTVDEYSGLTEVTNLVSTTLHVSGADLPAATVLGTGAASVEAYEGVLINVSGTCTDDDISNGEWELDDGSGVLVVDDMFFDVLPTVGYEYDVTGPQTYSYGAYKIEPRDVDDVVETAVDFNEPNDNLTDATAITGNDTLSGIIDPTDDVDFFTFTLTVESEVTIDLFIAGYSSLDGEIALFDSDSTELDSDDSGLSGGDEQIIAILGAGTYYIGAADWSDLRASTGAYALGFFAEPFVPDPGETCDAAIAYGAVNSVEATGSIASGETVWYSFTVDDAYESILVSLCGSDFDTKLYIWLDCDSSSYEYYNDDNYTVCTTGSRSAIEITGDPALPLGEYYVHVMGYGSSSGNYVLEITGETELLAADFVVTSMTMDADTLDVVVTNQGTADSPGYSGTDWHGYYINGVYQGYVYESGVALAIGASYTYSIEGFNYYELGDSGDFEIVFECDTDNDVLELDETNNLDTLDIHIDLPPASPINFVAEGGPGFNDLTWEPSPEALLPPAAVGMHNNVDVRREKPELTTDRSNILAEKRLALGIRPFTRTQGDSCENPLVALADTNSAPYQPVWYEYTATRDGHIIVTSDILSQTTDTKVYVYSDCAGTEIGNDDDGGTGFTSVFGWNVTTGTTYYIFWVDTWSSAAFDWELIENTGPLPAPDLVVTEFWSSADTVFAEVSNIGTDDAGSSNSCHWYVNGVDVGYAYTSALAPGESDTIGLYGLTYANFGPDTLEIGVEVDYWDYDAELDEDNVFIWDTDFVVPIPDYLPTYNVYREETTREFVLIAEDLDADDWAFNGYYRDADVVSGTEYCYYATQNLPDDSESVASNEDCATADPAGAVEGVVTDLATTLPMIGVSVEVTTIDGDFIALDSTDADGYYLVEYLPLGFSEIGYYATGYHAAGFGIDITDGDTVEQNIALVPDTMTQAVLYSTGFETGDDDGTFGSFAGDNSFVIADTFITDLGATVLPATGSQMLTFPEPDSLTYASNDEAYWIAGEAVMLTGREEGEAVYYKIDANYATESGWDYFYLVLLLDDQNWYYVHEMTGNSNGWVEEVVDISWVIDSGSSYFVPMVVFEADGSIVSGWGGAFDNAEILYDDFYNAPVADLEVTHYEADATLTWAAPASRGTVEYELQRVDPENPFEFDDSEGVVAMAKGPRPKETVTMTHEYSNPSRTLVGYKVYRQDHPFPLTGPAFLDLTTDLTYTDATVVAGNYYDFAVTTVYDVGESKETIVSTKIGAVTQVDPFAEDFEGLTAIPTGWEAFTTHPDGITWTVGDSAAADTAFGTAETVNRVPDHTDFAFVEDATGAGVPFETILISPFIDASDMYSAIVSFSGFVQSYGDFYGYTVAEIFVRVDMDKWHLISDISRDHTTGWVEYQSDVAEVISGKEYVQFGFRWFNDGWISTLGVGFAFDDFDLFGIAGPANLTAGGTMGQIELNWSEPGARSRELIRGNVVSQQLMMDRNVSDLVPGPAYDNRDACYSNWLPSGWLTGFYGPNYFGPDSGYAAPKLTTLFEFPPGPMTLEMAIHHGIWYFGAGIPVDPWPDTVRAFITVATTDLAGVTQNVIHSDTVFYVLETGIYYAATLDLVGLTYEQTDSSYLKVVAEPLDDADHSQYSGANVWIPQFRIDDPTDDINSGLSGYDSSGIFQQDDTYDWFLEICGTPTPPALRYNVYRDDEFIAGPLEEMTYTDEDVAALVDYDYFVTGYVPIVLASDNPGDMIFVDTDSSNHDVAAAPNTPPTAPALAAPADNFTAMITDITGSSMFVWSPAADADPGQTVGYDFVLTLGTYTWEISTDIPTVSIPNEELYTEIDNQSATALTGIWNVVATDGFDDTPASNGPRNITVDISPVSVDQGAQIPDVFALHQNYPNPFNPTTTINYDIPEISNVRIEIYNLLGQKVRTLVKAELAPAYYHVQWDGTTDAGATVASGMYIYRIEAGSFSAIRKLVIMK